MENIFKSMMDHKCSNTLLKWEKAEDSEEVSLKMKGLKRCGFFNATNDFTPRICKGHKEMLTTSFMKKYGISRYCY